MSIEYTPTALWNDSSDPSELAQSISFGGVGATCNPTIAYTCINQRREAEGKNASPIGPVVTLMVGRLDDWIKEVAKCNCLFIDPGHFERCGVAAFKRAYEPDDMTPDRNEHAGAHATQQRSHPLAPRHCDEHRCSDTANGIDKERNRALLTPPHRFETIENRIPADQNYSTYSQLENDLRQPGRRLRRTLTFLTGRQGIAGTGRALAGSKS